MTGEVVPFGKYKGQPVEVMMADARAQSAAGAVYLCRSGGDAPQLRHRRGRIERGGDVAPGKYARKSRSRVFRSG
jgi:hypothetical protein